MMREKRGNVVPWDEARKELVRRRANDVLQSEPGSTIQISSETKAGFRPMYRYGRACCGEAIRQFSPAKPG